VRCAEQLDSEAGRALCPVCLARLRALLSARAGVRRNIQRSRLWPLALFALTTLFGVLTLLRHLSGLALEPAVVQRGTWQILDASQFNSPVGLAEDRVGNLYVVDSANYRVYKLAPTGEVLAAFGTHGAAFGEFDHPSAIALDRVGNLYVADTGNNRIQELSTTGVSLGSFGSLGNGPGQFRSPRGVAVDHEGNVYVSDTGNDRVQKLSPFGRVMAVWGRSGQGPGEFRQPYGLSVDMDGALYVADTANHRVQKLSPQGVPLTDWGSYGDRPGQFDTRAPALGGRAGAERHPDLARLAQRQGGDGPAVRAFAARSASHISV